MYVFWRSPVFLLDSAVSFSTFITRLFLTCLSVTCLSTFKKQKNQVKTWFFWVFFALAITKLFWSEHMLSGGHLSSSTRRVCFASFWTFITKLNTKHVTWSYQLFVIYNLGDSDKKHINIKKIKVVRIHRHKGWLLKTTNERNGLLLALRSQSWR